MNAETQELTTIDKINNLAETGLVGFEKLKQEGIKTVEENPFIEIIDNLAYKEACKRRTTLKSFRTKIQNDDKDIATAVSKFRKLVISKNKELIDITDESEKKQQTEIDRYDSVKLAEKLEKERIEGERKQKLVDEAEKIINDARAKINALVYSGIQELKDDFNNNLSTIDATKFEDYENTFKGGLIGLKTELAEKVKTLEEKETIRLQQEEIAKEKARLKADAELKQKRGLELQPYIMFIRKYDELINKPESDYLKEFGEIKKGAQDHWEHERKEAIKKQKEEEERQRKQKQIDLANARKEAELKAESKRLKDIAEKIEADALAKKEQETSKVLITTVEEIEVNNPVTITEETDENTSKTSENSLSLDKEKAINFLQSRLNFEYPEYTNKDLESIIYDAGKEMAYLFEKYETLINNLK